MLRARSDGPSRSISGTGSARAELGPARETAGKRPGNRRAARARKPPPRPPVLPPRPPRGSAFPRAAAERSEPPPSLRSRRTGGFATNFLANDSGRSRRPCPQPQPRGSCRGRRALRTPRGRRRRRRVSFFWGGQKAEVGERRFSAQAAGRVAPRRGRRCRRSPAAAPRLRFPPSRQGRATAGGGGGGAVLPAALHGGGSGPEPAPSRPKTPRRREGTGAPTCAHPAGGGALRGHTPFSGGHASFALAHAPFGCGRAPSPRRSGVVGGDTDPRGPPIGAAPRPSGRSPPPRGRQ